MKFGKFLRASRVKGWEDYYVDYKKLTRAVKAETELREQSTELTLDALESTPLSGGCFQDEFIRQIESVNLGFDRKMSEIEERRDLMILEAQRTCAESDRSSSFGSLDPESYNKLRTLQKESMQLMLRELYQDCMTLKQVCDLNFTGLSKALKKYNKSLKQAGQQLHVNVNLQDQAFHIGVSRVEEVAEQVEECYAALFTSNDTIAAQRRLRHLHRLGIESQGWLGFYLGASLVCLIVILWFATYFPTKDKCPYCFDSLDTTVPVYRVLFMPILWLWCWCGLCYVWKEFSVNYPFIMSINPYTELGYDRAAMLAAFLTLALLSNFALFLGAVQTGYEPLGIPFHLYPMGLVLFGLLALFAPKGTFHFKSRRYLFKAMLRIVVAPLGPEVRFVDNYIADVLTSMAVFLRDVDYTIQFYASGAFQDPNMEVELNREYWVSAPLITALPYWFRLQQCVRRFYDAGPGHPDRKVHLLNAGKYATSLTATCMAALGDYTHLNFDELGSWDIGKAIWFTVLVVGTVYAYIWDIFMDWGLLEWNGNCCMPFKLRSHRVYSYKIFYIWAAFSNLVGRCAWAITITPHGVFSGVPKALSTTAMAVIELLRRAQWSLIRVEYEYTSNPTHYRSVKEVPMMLNTEGYQEDAKENDKKRFTLTGIFVGAINAVITLVVLLVIYQWYHQKKSGTPAPSAAW
uniref:SPX domain-containing protein n=1 Tax=Hanusia phi TaxID=3032 RepID=A0A7S0HI86_9CRYP|mmetsp:Transcript_22802/g.51404  ORF Transcript_22802/g.51404 Transcript_22802/m.51404 type:complete len:688 (+) Transcript_22802:151-2214(+)